MAISRWCKVLRASNHEVTALKNVSERLLAAQFPVLSWWAVVAVLTRAATTLTVLSIILLGTWLFQQRPDLDRRDRHLHGLCRAW